MATVPWFRNNSLGFRSGWLAPGDSYLDNSGRIFQKGSYHLGNGLRTTGRTFGVKLGHWYLTLWLTRVNSTVSQIEAKE